MVDAIVAIAGTQLPTAFVIFGALGLFLVIVKRVGTFIELDHSQRKWLTFLSILLLASGISLFVVATREPSPSQAISFPTSVAIIEAEESPNPLNEDCLANDFIPSLGGTNPPIGTFICIPVDRIAWISSDPAVIEISGFSPNTLPTGFTFTLFGPVRFRLSEVTSGNVRLDLRTDASLLGNKDGKSLNLVYQDGLVCDYSVYTGSSCP